MAVTLPAPAPLVIAVNRSGKDFSEQERLLLNLLRPHLIQAYRNAESATRLRQDSTLLELSSTSGDGGNGLGSPQ